MADVHQVAPEPPAQRSRGRYVLIGSRCHRVLRVQGTLEPMIRTEHGARETGQSDGSSSDTGNTKDRLRWSHLVIVQSGVSTLPLANS